MTLHERSGTGLLIARFLAPRMRFTTRSRVNERRAYIYRNSFRAVRKKEREKECAYTHDRERDGCAGVPRERECAAMGTKRAASGTR